MRKRVLLAEASDTIRGVAEAKLRQSGFEVISVSSSDKALEVLKFTRPDLVLIGADLTTAGNRRLCDRLLEDHKTGSLAMLVLAAESDQDLPFPPEAIITKPFDPGEFVEKVLVFSGGSGDSPPRKRADYGDSIGLDEEALDAALGLDDIDVTESEVLNRAGTPRKRPKVKATSESLVTETDDDASGGDTDSGKVESIVIHEDELPGADPNKAGPSGKSGKIEILSDQYGMNDPSILEPQVDNQEHDYDWFINEMRKEAAPGQPSGTDADRKPPSEKRKPAEPSAEIDRATPAPAAPAQKSRQRSENVESFLDEFRKEVAKIQADDDEMESVSLGPDADETGSVSKQERAWQETIENITDKQVALFTERLCRRLADRLAERISAKIDSEKLLGLIKNEILDRTRER